MQLNRQQKRAMLRRLNDKAKMRVVMDRIEKATIEAHEKPLRKRQRIVYTVLQWVVIAAIISWFVFA